MDTHRQTDRHSWTHTDRQIDTHGHTETDIQTKTLIDRQRQTDRQTGVYCAQ